MTDPTDTEIAAAERLMRDVAGRDVPPPGPDFMARLAADALAAMPGAEGAGPGPAAAPGWRDWLRALGGWPALGGMVAAGVAGLWIGVAPPAAVDLMLADFLGETVSVDLMGLSDVAELEG